MLSIVANLCLSMLVECFGLKTYEMYILSFLHTSCFMLRWAMRDQNKNLLEFIKGNSADHL